MESIVSTVFGRVLDWLLLCDSLVEIFTAEKNKMKKTGLTKKKILDYNTLAIVGSLGSMSQYAKAQGISHSKAQKELEKNLAYSFINSVVKKMCFNRSWCLTYINNGG